MIGVLEKALEHGILAVAVLALTWALVRMYKDREKLRKEYEERIQEWRQSSEDQDREHRREMRELQQRYITKAETWMAKYHELSHGMTAVLDSLERRWGR